MSEQRPPHPRVISVPAPPQLARVGAAPPKRERKSGFGSFIQSFVLAPIAVLALAAVVLSGAFTVGDRTRQWARDFKIQGDSILIDDVSREERNGWELALAVRELRRLYAANPEGLTLAFTQAEIAYYSDVPFISYFDQDTLSLYLPQSKEELWSRLRDLNIKYLLVPGFPYSEITNTAFDQLLADPSLVEVLFNEGGHHVYRVRETSTPLQTHLIAREAGEQLRLSDWSTTVYRASGPPSAVTWADDGLLVNVARRPFADRQRWDYLRRGDVAGDGAVAFEAPPGVSVLSLDLTGRGRFELYAVHREGTRIIQTQIWIGVLNGGRRTISGQFRVDGERSIPMSFFLSSYRVTPYEVHGWEVRSLTAPRPAQPEAPDQEVALEEPTQEPLPVVQPEPRGPDISAVYMLRQPPANASTFDYLIHIEDLKVRVEVATNAVPIAAVAHCADGRSNLTLTAGAAPNVYRSDLPCWPQSLSIVWPPSFESRQTNVTLVATTGQQSHTLPLVSLGALLDEAGRGRRENRR